MRELNRSLIDRSGPAHVNEAPVADWQPTLTKRKGATKHKLLTERIIADIDADIGASSSKASRTGSSAIPSSPGPENS